MDMNIDLVAELLRTVDELREEVKRLQVRINDLESTYMRAYPIASPPQPTLPTITWNSSNSASLTEL